MHVPIPGGQWNGGYCFTSCARCGRDMVRSAFGEWHVPQGFRVVWSAEPPRDLAAAMQARDTAGRPVVAMSDGQPVPPPPVPAQPNTAGITPTVPKSVAGGAERSPFSFDDFD